MLTEQEIAAIANDCRTQQAWEYARHAGRLLDHITEVEDVVDRHIAEQRETADGIRETAGSQMAAVNYEIVGALESLRDEISPK